MEGKTKSGKNSKRIERGMKIVRTEEGEERRLYPHHPHPCTSPFILSVFERRYTRAAIDSSSFVDFSGRSLKIDLEGERCSSAAQPLSRSRVLTQKQDCEKGPLTREDTTWSLHTDEHQEKGVPLVNCWSTTHTDFAQASKRTHGAADRALWTACWGK